MTQVVSSLNGVGETERDDLSCNNCAQIFSRKKFLRRHMEACEGSGAAQESEETSAKQKGYSCSECDSSFRKQKIGSTLVKKAIEAMVEDDADEVVLETEITNKPALKLYENLGFVRDKRLFRYYLNGVDASRLKLWLR